MKRALTACAAAILTGSLAAAQEVTAARDARTVPLAATPMERLRGSLEDAARRLPLTAKLVPPTRGKVKLAVVLVELADCPRPSWKREAWQDMLFSNGQWKRDPDGHEAFGSVH